MSDPKSDNDKVKHASDHAKDRVKEGPGEEKDEDLVQNPAVDDFFSRMNYDMRRPKPGQEAISAALQAIQRLGVEAGSEDSSIAENGDAGAIACPACGNQNPDSNKFCATCGIPLHQSAGSGQAKVGVRATTPKSIEPAAGPHHYHHHYHHHYFASEGMPQANSFVAQPSQTRDSSTPAREVTPRGRAPLSGSTPGRAEAAVKKVTQDWALACNTAHLDDLVELYTADAVVLRPNVSPVRGSASIREFLFSVLSAGLGEVEMDALRTDLFGEVACEAGRCKMLVPSATGKRREERGKYLLVLTKQAGEWKILADCWSSDLSLGIVAETASPKSR